MVSDLVYWFWLHFPGVNKFWASGGKGSLIEGQRVGGQDEYPESLCGTSGGRGGDGGTCRGVGVALHTVLPGTHHPADPCCTGGGRTTGVARGSPRGGRVSGTGPGRSARFSQRDGRSRYPRRSHRWLSDWLPSGGVHHGFRRGCGAHSCKETEGRRLSSDRLRFGEHLDYPRGGHSVVDGLHAHGTGGCVGSGLCPLHHRGPGQSDSGRSDCAVGGGEAYDAPLGAARRLCSSLPGPALLPACLWPLLLWPSMRLRPVSYTHLTLPTIYSV